MDEFDANTTPYDETSGEQHVSGSSRRNFLKAAVVGSAAAVAVGGVGAATLSLTGHHTGLTRLVVLAGISGITSDACTTDTGDKQGKLTEKSTFHGESLYFWALFKNVPKGTYSLGIDPAISSTILTYQTNSKGNAVFVYEFAGGSRTYDCNPGSIPSGESISQGSMPVNNFYLGSTTDLLLRVHLDSNAKKTGKVTLTANLYQGTTATGTAIDSASATITVTSNH